MSSALRKLSFLELVENQRKVTRPGIRTFASEDDELVDAIGRRDEAAAELVSALGQVRK